nr:hypothetical protein [Nonomuraea longispora]
MFGATIGLASIAGDAGPFFVLTLQLQNGTGYSPLAAGLIFVPLAVAFAAASLLGPRIQAVLGHHALTLGYAINAAGTLALLVTAWAAGTGATGWIPLPALAVIGFGEGLGVSPLIGTVLTGVPAKDAGAAGGVLETADQVGMSLGVAVLGLVFFAFLGPRTSPAAYSEAFTITLIGNLALALTALVLLPPLLRGRALRDGRGRRFSRAAFQAVGQPGERFADQPVIDVVAVPLPFDPAGVVQEFHVLGDGRFGESDEAGDLAGGAGPYGEQLEDLQAGRIARRAQQFEQVGGGDRGASLLLHLGEGIGDQYGRPHATAVSLPVDHGAQFGPDEMRGHEHDLIARVRSHMGRELLQHRGETAAGQRAPPAGDVGEQAGLQAWPVRGSAGVPVGRQERGEALADTFGVGGQLVHHGHGGGVDRREPQSEEIITA